MSDLVVMQSKHTMSCIFHLKKLATGFPISKTLIKYNSNSLDENNEIEKEPIDIELTEQIADPEMMKILSNLDDRMY